MHFNQWKGAHVVGQTNTCGHGCNSFFCYTKRASFGGLSNFLVASCPFYFCLCILKNLISGVNAKEFDLLLDSIALRTLSHSSFGSGLKRKCKDDKSLCTYWFFHVAKFLRGDSKHTFCWLLEACDPLVSCVVSKVHTQNHPPFKLWELLLTFLTPVHTITLVYYLLIAALCWTCLHK